MYRYAEYSQWYHSLGGQGHDLDPIHDAIMTLNVKAPMTMNLQRVTATMRAKMPMTFNHYSDPTLKVNAYGLEPCSQGNDNLEANLDPIRVAPKPHRLRCL
jgi:hypothetical protein